MPDLIDKKYDDISLLWDCRHFLRKKELKSSVVIHSLEWNCAIYENTTIFSWITIDNKTFKKENSLINIIFMTE